MSPTPPDQLRRLVFLGTPDMAVPPLRALADADFDIALVVTRPDKRRGRGPTLSPSPVKAAAIDLGLPVSHDVDAVLDSDADLGVVVAFGRLIKPHVLERLPMVNLHFSLLPRWRGAAPVERAVLAGDRTTGVCVMAVDETLDTGAIYRRVAVPIGPHETAAEVRSNLVKVGTELLVTALSGGLGQPEPQEGEPTYAEKLSSEDLRIDWTASAVEIERAVRVGGAWTTWRAKRLKLWRAEAQARASAMAPGQIEGVLAGTGSGLLELGEVQPEGRARLPAAAWVNGAHPGLDDRLGA